MAIGKEYLNACSLLYSISLRVLTGEDDDHHLSVKHTKNIHSSLLHEEGFNASTVLDIQVTHK